MSCLKDDLSFLENGDKTMVGQRGIVLSGGQKVRLSIARSIYSDADIYLFDDPISAVDTKVARRLYYNCFLKLKGAKTIFFVTHQIPFLEICDKVLIMDDGRII